MEGPRWGKGEWVKAGTKGRVHRGKGDGAGWAQGRVHGGKKVNGGTKGKGQGWDKGEGSRVGDGRKG